MTQSPAGQLLSSLPDGPVQLVVFDLDGVPRGKLMSRAKLAVALNDGGLGFCNVIFGWDTQDAAYDNATVSGWQTGFPDAAVRLYPDTLRRQPWADGTPFLIADLDGGDLAEVCPRSCLRRVLAKASSRGYRIDAAVEYEWFTFAETPGSLAVGAGAPPHPVTPGMHGYSLIRPAANRAYVRQLWSELTAFDVPLEGLHTETGPGAYEAAIHYTDALVAADRAACLKLGVKQIALQHGLTASFMAKWTEALPGCSGHFHQSLVDADTGANLFVDAEASDGMSAILRHYLAGQLHWLPRLLPLFAPTVNSYKRLVPGSWAPTTVSWGHENRTTACRIVTGFSDSGPRTHLETRTPGADANPYLVAAAAIAAGLDGIARERPLELPATAGTTYDDASLARLPTNLAAATARMKVTRAAAGELLGEVFVDHFLRTRDWEWRAHEGAVTDWERRRYLEIV